MFAAICGRRSCVRPQTILSALLLFVGATVAPLALAQNAGTVYQCNDGGAFGRIAVATNSLGLSVSVPNCGNMVAMPLANASLTLQRWHPTDAADPFAIWQAANSLPAGWSLWTPNGWQTLAQLQSGGTSSVSPVSPVSPVPPVPNFSSGGQTFPSLGLYAIQNDHDYGNPAFIARAALSDIVIMNMWNGWRDPGTGFNSLQVIQAINAASTRHTLSIAYMVPVESADYAPFPAWLSQVNAANWWARTVFPWGSLVLTGGGDFWMNVMPGGPTGVGGRTYDQYAADYAVDFYYNGGAAGLATDAADPVNGLWAGVYQDNLFPWMPASADWARVGAAGSGTLIQYTSGQLAITQRVQADKPGSLAFGNLSYTQDGAYVQAMQQAYAGHYDGGVMEWMTGSLYSIENICSAACVQATYANQMGLLNSSQLGVFTSYNITPNGEDQIDTAVPYQASRMALAMCMVLGNARCDLETGSSIDNNVALWFDEDAVDTSTRRPCTTPNASCAPYLGYLGTAVDPPQTAAYQGCYWRRRFQYGEVWWSPKECPAGTLYFGYTVNFIAGVQAPWFNTGGSGQTHPISNRDGIVVLY